MILNATLRTVETVHPEIEEAVMQALAELHHDHLAPAPTPIAPEAVAITRPSKFASVPGDITLDDYQRRWFNDFTREMRRIGLPMQVDGTTITLTGRLCDVDHRTFPGRAILSDTVNMPFDAPVVITVDGYQALKWHHIDAEQRKAWFSRLAAHMGYNPNDLGLYPWRQAKNAFIIADDASQEHWLDVMGSPEPFLTEFDQFLAIGRTYVVRPA